MFLRAMCIALYFQAARSKLELCVRQLVSHLDNVLGGRLDTESNMCKGLHRTSMPRCWRR